MNVNLKQLGTSLLVVGFSLFFVASTGHSTAAASSSPQLAVIQSDAGQIVIELGVPNYDLRQEDQGGSTYSVLSIAGLENGGAPGDPQLPIKGAMVGIPPGAQPSLSILADESTTDSLAHPPIPAATPKVDYDPREALPQIKSNSFTPNPAVYSANQLYPSEPAKIASVGNWRSQHYASVEFHPLQYNPATRQLFFHRRVRVAIKLDYSRGMTAEALGQPSSEGPFETVLQKTFVNYESAKNWRTPNVASASSGSLAPNLYSGGPWYRIGVNSDGIYQVTCGQLATAAGNSLSIDPTTLQMEKQGTPLAIKVVGSGWGACNSSDSSDYVEFFGQAPNAKYTNTNIYWLTYGNGAGKRMLSHDGSGSGAVTGNFTDTIHLEQNLYYLPYLPMVEDSDHWYWTYLYPPAGLSSQDYTFQLANVATGSFSATLQVDFMGYSAGNHHTQVSINGNLIDDTALDNITWSGQTERNATIAFPQSYLTSGTNTIHVVAPDSSDFIFTNYFNVSYQDTLTATTDALNFTQVESGPTHYQVSGFSTGSIETFDISDPFNVAQVINTTVTPGPCPCSLQFADSTIGTHQYLALTSAQRQNPVNVTLDTSSNLHSTSNGADYIIIANSAFLSNIQPLAAYRASQGLRVKVIDVQNVYDEFSDGLVDAQALHDFLQYAYTNWQPPAPSFVLLVGSGNLDPKGYCTAPAQCPRLSTPPTSTLIPPYLRMVDPFLGETASDNRLVAFDASDTLPDMSIGRLPAYTTADVDAMVNKILSYEQNPPAGSWRTQVAFVADQPDSAGDFWGLSDLVASSPTFMPAPFTPDRIYYSNSDPNSLYTTPAAAHAAVLSDINNGRLIVNFVGHSFYYYWSSAQFLTRDDIPTLTNGSMTPVMIEMTCYTGYFIQPGSPSLAETNVRQPGGGAVASWAATGLGVATGHDFLDEGFFNAVMQQGVYQLGPATILGKINLWQSTGGVYYDLIDTFDLFGDPATRLAVPQADVAINKSVQPSGTVPMGSPLTYTLTFTNNGPGLAERVMITDTLASVLLNPKVSFTGVPITATGTTLFVWNVGNLAPGAGGTITINATLDHDQSHYTNLTLTNTALISTATAQTNTTNDQSSVTSSILKRYFMFLPFIQR